MRFPVKSCKIAVYYEWKTIIKKCEGIKMITLQCQLEFQNKQDKEIVLDLMRRFSSAMRYAYKRLLEGNKRKDLKKQL